MSSPDFSPLSVRNPDTGMPRERLLRHGAAVLSDAELLAVILRTGVAGCPVVTLGQQLLLRFGGLRGLFGADLDMLQRVPGLGAAKSCQLAAIMELSRRTLGEELGCGDVFDAPQRVKEYCALTLAHRRIEHCMALFLDNQHRLIASVELASGTLTQAAVYPREVVRQALSHHAAALILAHNHPSGSAEPSQADLSLTRHLRQALALVDVRLLDHMIVAADQVVSLAERGQM